MNSVLEIILILVFLDGPWRAFQSIFVGQISSDFFFYGLLVSSSIFGIFPLH
jgi:hypothetical protein